MDYDKLSKRFKELSQEFADLAMSDEKVGIIFITTYGDANDPSYKYNFNVMGDANTLADAMANELANNILEGDGGIHDLFQEALDCVQEIVEEQQEITQSTNKVLH